MPAELVDLAADLHVGDVGVQVEPVDARHVEADMTVEHVVDVHHAGHPQMMRARGPALPARQAITTTARARRGPGGGPDLPPLMMRRGFDLVEGGSATADFLNDLFCRLVPHKRFGIFVPCDRPHGQSLDKGTHAREHAASQPASGQVGEPAPHEVEPRRTGGHEMQVPARLFSLRKPTFHLWAHVGRKVVEHYVHRQASGRGPVDLLEKRRAHLRWYERLRHSVMTSPMPILRAANRSTVPFRL